MSKSESAISEFEIQLNRLIQTPHGRRLFLASVPLLFAACASDGHRTREGNLKNGEVKMSVADEQAMTREALPSIRHDYPALQDADVQRYVANLGARLVVANALSGQPYTYNFTVVDVPMVNAFALPAGTVFVTAPLLAMADSEAELAGVIGHELGHVKARHAAQRIEAQKEASTKSWLYGVGGGLLGAAGGFGLSKLICRSDDAGCMATTFAAGAAAGVGGGLLIQKYKFMANSREDEMEADRIGFKAAVRAGYTPSQSGAFYTKLLKMEEASKGSSGAPLMSSISDAMATHPPSKERVQQMNQLIAQTPQNKRTITNTVAFDRARMKVQQIEKSRPQAT